MNKVFYQLLTKSQKTQLGEIIELYHSALLVELLGDNVVSKSMIDKLKLRGLYPKEH